MCYSTALPSDATGPTHAPFRKALALIHARAFLEKVRKVRCAFSDSRPQSRKAVIKNRRNEEEK